MNSAESCIVCLVCAAGWTESIDNVKHKWLQLVEKHCTQIPIMIIINNKKQLDQQASPVTEEEIFRDFEDTVANKKVRFNKKSSPYERVHHSKEYFGSS